MRCAILICQNRSPSPGRKFSRMRLPNPRGQFSRFAEDAQKATEKRTGDLPRLPFRHTKRVTETDGWQDDFTCSLAATDVNWALRFW